MRFANDRSKTFNMGVDTSSLNALLDGMGDKLEQAARPAAQAAAEVFYQAVLRNVEAIGRVTGNLRGSIYQKHIPEQSGPGKATYTVTWRTARRGTRAPHGHLIEFGHIQKYASYIGSDGKWHTAVKNGKPVLRKGGPVQMPARPFVRPALAKEDEAVEAARRVLLEALK